MSFGKRWRTLTSKFKVALVGEAFGAVEALEGKPFLGPAGQQLDSIIEQLGRKRDEFYITNVVNERPPNNNFGVYYEDKGRKKPTDKLLNRWMYIRCRFLGHGEDGLKPNVVVALGNEALKATTGLTGIEKWRGSILESASGYKVIPTYHPATLTRGGRTRDGVPIRPIMMMDFKRALAQSAYPQVRYKQRTRHIQPAFHETEEFLKRVFDQKLRVAIDIETEGREISCVGFATSPTESMCVPLVKSDFLPYWLGNDERYIKALMRRILVDPDIKKIFQNGGYDVPWLERDITNDEPVQGYDFDTYVAMNCCFPEFPYGLAFMTSIFTDIPYFKDDGKDHKRVRDYPKLWTYNCNDVLSTFECALKLEQEMEIRGLA